jgi:hypothetical protein
MKKTVDEIQGYWKNHPVEFIQQVCGAELNAYQIKIMNKILQERRDTCGKS